MLDERLNEEPVALKEHAYVALQAYAAHAVGDRGGAAQRFNASLIGPRRRQPDQAFSQPCECRARRTGLEFQMTGALIAGDVFGKLDRRQAALRETHNDLLGAGDPCVGLVRELPRLADGAERVCPLSIEANPPARCVQSRAQPVAVLG